MAGCSVIPHLVLPSLTSASTGGHVPPVSFTAANGIPIMRLCTGITIDELIVADDPKSGGKRTLVMGEEEETASPAGTELPLDRPISGMFAPKYTATAIAPGTLVVTMIWDTGMGVGDYHAVYSLPTTFLKAGSWTDGDLRAEKTPCAAESQPSLHAPRPTSTPLPGGGMSGDASGPRNFTINGPDIFVRLCTAMTVTHETIDAQLMDADTGQPGDDWDLLATASASRPVALPKGYTFDLSHAPKGFTALHADLPGGLTSSLDTANTVRVTFGGAKVAGQTSSENVVGVANLIELGIGVWQNSTGRIVPTPCA